MSGFPSSCGLRFLVSGRPSSSLVAAYAVDLVHPVEDVVEGRVSRMKVGQAMRGRVTEVVHM